MRVIANFETGTIEVSMYHNGMQAVSTMSPMSAKLIGELLIENGNKMMEYKRSEKANEG